MIGFGVVEERGGFENEEIRRYAVAGMRYPCYIVKIDRDNPLKGYEVDVLRRMFVNGDGDSVNLYFDDGSKVVGFGSIKASQVKPFLTLFSSHEVIGYLTEAKPLRGDLLYVLAG